MSVVKTHSGNGAWVAALFVGAVCATTAFDLIGGAGASIRWSEKLYELVFGGLGGFLGGWTYSGLRSRSPGHVLGWWVVAAAAAGAVSAIPLLGFTLLRADIPGQQNRLRWIALAAVPVAAVAGVLWAWCGRTAGVRPWFGLRPNDR